MTCIAGLVQDGKVYMGSDSAGANDRGDLDLCRSPKVFLNGPYLIGASGSGKAHQLLKYLSLPEHYSSIDPYRWAYENILPEIKEAIRKANWTPEESFEALIGFSGRLFHIWGATQVGESGAGYDACGSGAQVARGSLFTSHGDDGAEERLRCALEASERFCMGVRGPFTVLSI